MKETGAAHHLPPFVIDLVNRSWDRKVASFLEAHRAGVRFAAGSDNGSPAAPHPDIATEIEILARIGLGPYQALRAATAHAARLLGLGDEIGTVETGKRADLVVLSADPLRDVSAVRSVDAVIHDGQWYGREAAADAPDGGRGGGPGLGTGLTARSDPARVRGGAESTHATTRAARSTGRPSAACRDRRSWPRTAQ